MSSSRKLEMFDLKTFSSALKGKYAFHVWNHGREKWVTFKRHLSIRRLYYHQRIWINSNLEETMIFKVTNLNCFQLAWRFWVQVYWRIFNQFTIQKKYYLITKRLKNIWRNGEKIRFIPKFLQPSFVTYVLSNLKKDYLKNNFGHGS